MLLDYSSCIDSQTEFLSPVTLWTLTPWTSASLASNM